MMIYDQGSIRYRVRRQNRKSLALVPGARASTTGSPRRVVQIHVLDDRGEVPRVGLRAEARGPQPVLDVEDSPARGDPAQITGRRVVALPVLEALLINGDIE